jgi:hypothetical protein
MDHDPVEPAAPATGVDIDDLLPPYVPPPAPARRRPGKVVALAVGIVALLAASAFAVVSLTGDDGAGSPEDAVRQLLDAGSHEDLIGVMEALPPGERGAILDPVEDIAGELKRLGILDGGLDLSDVGGLDLEFSDVELSSTPLADGIAEVTVTRGTARARAIPKEIPIGPELDRILEGWGGSTEFDPTTSTEDMSGTRLVAIEEGGGCHVSLFYSIAEAARRDGDSPLPPFGHGVAARGAASPEAAVEEAVRAATALDVRRLVELTPPDEMRALHDYAPLFLDDAEQEVATMREDGVRVTVDDLVTEAKGSGDTRHVGVKRVSLRVTDGDTTGSFSWNGRCMDFDPGDGSDARHECTDDAESPLHDVKVPEDMGVTVVRRDGAWYVSPTRTLLDLLVSALRAVDKGTIDKLADPEGLFGSMFGTSGRESYSSDSSTGFVVPRTVSPGPDGCEEMASQYEDPQMRDKVRQLCARGATGGSWESYPEGTATTVTTGN